MQANYVDEETMRSNIVVLSNAVQMVGSKYTQDADSIAYLENLRLEIIAAEEALVAMMQQQEQA
jgi:hypothetical protein